jgi:hypothetical protein
MNQFHELYLCRKQDCRDRECRSHRGKAKPPLKIMSVDAVRRMIASSRAIKQTPTLTMTCYLLHSPFVSCSGDLILDCKSYPYYPASTAFRDQFDSIDLSGNEIVKLGAFPAWVALVSL